MNIITTQKKKILIVIPSMGGGGAERVVVNLANHLDSGRYGVSIATFQERNDYVNELDKDINIMCLGKKSKWDFLKLILRLRKVIKEHKPDVVLSLIYYANIITLFAGMSLKRNFKVIISEHIYSYKYLSEGGWRALKRCFMNFAYKKADKIITVSEGIKKILQDDFNIPAEKIVTIYNPIPFDVIVKNSQQAVVHPFFENGGNNVIIGMGRLEHQKRFDVLLKAFAIVQRQHNEARLIILGKGALQKDLEELTHKLNLNKFVNFAGFQPNPHAWVSKADIFVLSSDMEGFPMAILEAMACGVPVISTDCPTGPSEIIINGENGILVPPSNEKKLAEAMIALLEDKNHREKLSMAGQKKAEEFGIQKILNQYEKIFG